jgi:hypothetical protein
MFMKHTLHAVVILCIFAFVSNAYAALIDPVDPKVSVNFSFDQRMTHARQLHAQLREATPTERFAYFEKSIEAIKKLTQEERLALSDKFKTQWKKLSDEQKKEIKQEARNFIDSLPDAERKELKKRREKMLEFMSLEERKHWP